MIFIEVHELCPSTMIFIEVHELCPSSMIFIEVHESCPSTVNFLQVHESCPSTYIFIEGHWLWPSTILVVDFFFSDIKIFELQESCPKSLKDMSNVLNNQFLWVTWIMSHNHQYPRGAWSMSNVPNLTSPPYARVAAMTLVLKAYLKLAWSVLEVAWSVFEACHEHA